MQREDNQSVAETVEREQGRLRSFIRSRVPDWQDAEDILQDVFYEFVLASRLAKPVENAAAWLFRVARNRIVDTFRKRAASTLVDSGDDSLHLDAVLPSAEAGPHALYVRKLLLVEFEQALAELPPEQRDVFLAHEFEGRSFRDLAAETGLSINTLLGRKRYAVLHLRRRLAAAWDDWI
jgi:RNA polymerase sigma factor (sigma-70 family)